MEEELKIEIYSSKFFTFDIKISRINNSGGFQSEKTSSMFSKATKFSNKMFAVKFERAVNRHFVIQSIESEDNI